VAVTESDLLMLFSTGFSLWEKIKMLTLPFGYPKLTAVSVCISREGMTGISVMKCETANIWWIALLFPFGCFLLCISLLFPNRLSSHLLFHWCSNIYLTVHSRCIFVRLYGCKDGLLHWSWSRLHTRPNWIHFHKMSSAVNLGNYQRYGPLPND